MSELILPSDGALRPDSISPVPSEAANTAPVPLNGNAPGHSDFGRPKAVVMVIDDDPSVLTFVGMTLTYTGYRVLEMADGAKAKAALEARIPDLVITDMLMPGRDGIETLLYLRRRAPAVPVIAMTGGGDYLDLRYITETAAKLGARRILTKPFTMADLVTAVNSLLRARASDGGSLRPWRTGTNHG